MNIICPRCGSPNPAHHPAIQAEGEVTLCKHPFHGAPKIEPSADLVGRYESLKLRTAEGEARQANLPADPLTGFRKDVGERFAPQGREVSRWADSAMYRSAPMPKTASGRVGPTVTLINATPDPLGTLAQLAGIYKGVVHRSLSEITDELRREALTEFQNTKLQGPLEAIQLQFLIEGVTRSWTHQAVRGRHAFYAQESLRFAVVDGSEEEWNDRVAVPPGFEHWTPEQQSTWRAAVEISQRSYDRLVWSGIPAEDARGLMPHAMTTRMVWVCSLRELLYVAGVRLCTQAQFEWRSVMAGVVKALRGHSTVEPYDGDHGRDLWQFEALADALKPICYQEGKCGFMASFDRGCKIRDRVEANAKAGRPSSEWDQPSFKQGNPGHVVNGKGERLIGAIDPREWAADPNAARNV